MERYSPKERIVEFFKRTYELISTNYRMTRFEAMVESGEIEGCVLLKSIGDLG